MTDAPKKRVSFASTGAVVHSVIGPDGTQTISATGHAFLVLYPTDRPAGPRFRRGSLELSRVLFRRPPRAYSRP